MKKPTATDVAKLANVSVSTVSRYFNRSAYLAEDKIVAIEEAIESLGFISKASMNGRKHKEKLIGLVIPTFDSSFISMVLAGMEPAIQNSAYRLLIETTHWEKEREKRVIQKILSQGVDGLILTVSSLFEEEVRSLVGDLPVLILAGAEDSSYPCLRVDNVMGGKLATDYLISLGHQKIVHLYSDEIGNRDSIGRMEGYKASLNSAGIDIDENLILNGGYRASLSSRAIQSLIDQKVPFTAVFAANDLSALGAIQTLLKNGIRVPEQVSVIGFDDCPVASTFYPKLTTVRQPLHEMGKTAIPTMLDLISDREIHFGPLELKVVTRDSTSSAPIYCWVETL
ncbi:substrate-binding domain-containing protein [Vibrio sp. Y2-5]|uniref:LacI family DNA-binding transcriptional regulator n=1 Tax=Vibrio sp. Y2-5 TaxID=2743977 RepID=UPI001660E4D2|nr:substrate-binding domain-containing protein [Vibrio sp. Y2-5]MBD0785911.1 substrate-binding domain-containing protein [Vibrio sp. Y2-5]